MSWLVRGERASRGEGASNLRPVLLRENRGHRDREVTTCLKRSLVIFTEKVVVEVSACGLFKNKHPDVLL